MRRLDEPGRRRLKLLLELLIGEHGVGRKPDAWRRLLTVIEAIGQRSAYFSLLVENRKARERWVAICSEGDFLAAQLARNPALLDELIDERWVDTLPSRAELDEELAHRLSDVAPDDMEREVEALCRFKQAAVFRVALADLSGRLPLMSVSDRLTEIAELIVQRTLDLAWRQMVAQLGAPTLHGDRRQARARCASRHWATASSAASSWAMPRTWTWSSSTIPPATRRKPIAPRRWTTRCSSCASRSA